MVGITKKLLVYNVFLNKIKKFNNFLLTQMTCWNSNDSFNIFNITISQQPLLFREMLLSTCIYLSKSIIYQQMK